MQSWRTRSLAIPVLVVALSALLLLAVLQIVWISQLSQGAQERMQATASAGAEGISAAFDREIARAYLDLQMDALTLRDRRWSSYQQRYNAWKGATPYPNLVRAIYLAEIGRNGTLALRAYDDRSGAFHPQIWTSEFAGVLRSLDTTYRTRRTDGELIVGTSPAPIEESLPALIIPVTRPWLLGSPPADEPDLIDADLTIGGSVFNRSRRPCLSCGQEGPLFAYTIVRLDRAALEQTIIPDLARRHLGASVADYHVTIVDPSGETVYHSSEEAPTTRDAADASAQMLTLRVEAINQLVSGLGGSQLASSAPNADGRIQIAIGVSDGRQSAGAIASGWQLRLTHRAGSLEAAVASLRTRNLMISLGSIGLLATALVLLVFSTRRAQRAARRKVEFVAAISHELRTPLSVICSAGANLADGLVEDPERARQYGALIAREGRRLTEMVEQALAFAASQQERERAERRPIEPRELVERALAPYRSQIAELGMALEFSAEPGLAPISADREALQRAVHNLIGNALKYAAEGGWLRITVASDQRERRRDLLISVADRGPGISPADLPHVFEPFYRGSSALDSHAPGSGLGLSLVRQTAEAHGGEVSVETGVGRGCVFSLRLPYPRQTEQPPAVPEAAAARR